jgi:hypothetical protein
VKGIAAEMDQRLCLPEHGCFMIPLPKCKAQYLKLYRLISKYEIESRMRFFHSADEERAEMLKTRNERPAEQRAIEQRMDRLAAEYRRSHDRAVIDELQKLVQQLNAFKARVYH